ncbi:MAG TPA: hypothetical protein VH518_12315 [Tepidisphaeraceae bacterium]|jgi:hypothetical protein
MAIDVEWQDENGERLSRYDGPPIDGRLPERAPANSSCLRFVDPYGDTTFNAEQVAVLEKELASIHDNDEIGEQAKFLLAFVKRHPDRLHRYLKFIGD